MPHLNRREIRDGLTRKQKATIFSKRINSLQHRQHPRQILNVSPTSYLLQERNAEEKEEKIRESNQLKTFAQSQRVTMPSRSRFSRYNFFGLISNKRYNYVRITKCND